MDIDKAIAKGYSYLIATILLISLILQPYNLDFSFEKSKLVIWTEKREVNNTLVLCHTILIFAFLSLDHKYLAAGIGKKVSGGKEIAPETINKLADMYKSLISKK